MHVLPLGVACRTYWSQRSACAALWRYRQKVVAIFPCTFSCICSVFPKFVFSFLFVSIPFSSSCSGSRYPFPPSLWRDFSISLAPAFFFWTSAFLWMFCLRYSFLSNFLAFFFRYMCSCPILLILLGLCLVVPVSRMLIFGMQPFFNPTRLHMKKKIKVSEPMHIMLLKGLTGIAHDAIYN